MTHAERMSQFRSSDLYVVITEAFCGGRSSVEVLEACLQAGVKLIQFREKDLDDRSMFETARIFRQKTREAGTLLIIDDRVDIALATGADGVHLGQGDLPVTDARRIAPELIIGASTHSLDQALEAQDQGASYVNIGPIYATQTKELSMEPLGIDKLGHIASHLSIPFTCMGGIKEQHIPELCDKGSRHIALVTAVTAANDPRAAAEGLRELIQKSLS